MQVYVPLGDLMDILALINNGINFILYCTMSKQFRDQFTSLFAPSTAVATVAVVAAKVVNRHGGGAAGRGVDNGNPSCPDGSHKRLTSITAATQQLIPLVESDSKSLNLSTAV